ncbi:MAG: hypothetical protein GY717_00660 [Rhodobacteraceae bacterium]|nr:hypothetical protein [Paracoccaceae bacterium]
MIAAVVVALSVSAVLIFKPERPTPQADAVAESPTCDSCTAHHQGLKRLRALRSKDGEAADQ